MWLLQEWLTCRVMRFSGFCLVRLCRPPCGKASPYRGRPDLTEAKPPSDSQRRSLEFRLMLSGKAEPYRTGGRQSRIRQKPETSGPQISGA
jgi:hypothetical protein